MKKLVRITTVPLSLEKLLENQLQFMGAHYEVIAVSSDGARLKAFGENQNVRTFEVNLTREITPIKDLLAVWKLYRFLKIEKPFIVHTHTPKAGIVGMLASFLAGVPHRLHTVAGLPLLETKGLKRKILERVEKLTYRCATKVYPNSTGLKKIIVQSGFCSESKITVIGNGSSNGINTAYFSEDQISKNQTTTLRDSLHIVEKDFVFVFVGRIVGDKGINELIEAFQKINTVFKQTKLLLVGPFEPELDPLSENTLALIKSNTAILTVGYQVDVRPYLALSDCLVFPSYREGFPNVVLQAGAMGLPSIVSNINGCNEIVSHGQNGILISPKSEKEVYEAMCQVLENPVFFSSLQANARPSIVDRFEQQTIWNAILTEYQKLEHVS